MGVLSIGVMMASCLMWQTHGSLSHKDLDLIVQIQQVEPCTILLHKLDSSDVSVISKMITHPMLTMTTSNASTAKMQEVMLSKEVKCVTLFAQYATLDEGDIEVLLNRTTTRSVYVFEATEKKKMKKDLFHDYFKDSIIYVQSLSGNLMLLEIMDGNTATRYRNIIKLNDGKSIGSFKLRRKAARSSLKGRDMSISAIIIRPYVTYENKRYGGIEIDILEIVSHKMGFHYHVGTETLFSNRFGNASKDLSHIRFSTSFKYGSQRELSPEIYNLELVYVVPKPKPLTPYLNFVKPFTLTHWLAWIAAYLVCSAVSSWLLMRDKDNKMSVSQTALIMFGAMWQQNLATSKFTGPFFVLFGFWTVAVTFKGAAYNCDLRSCIVMKEYEKPIDTDQDLLGTSTELLLPSGTGLPETYRDSGTADKREIYARAVRENTIMTYKDYLKNGINRAKKGAAVINSKDRVYTDMTNYEKYFGYQPFRISKVSAFTSPAGWSIPLNEPWAEKFTMTILQILAGGIVNKITSDNIPRNKYSNPVQEEDVLEPYKLEHVAGPLILLAGGLLLSTIAACVEFSNRKVKLKSYNHQGSILPHKRGTHNGSGYKAQNTYETHK